MEMIGTEELIEQVLLKWGRGRIFFIRDIELKESPESIRHALSSLTEKRKILRLARGVYCFPKIVGEYTFRTVYPTDEEVAQAVAAHSGIRIIPFGDLAAAELGLTDFHVGQLRYRTDGTSRTIRLTSCRSIVLHHTSEMNMFAFRSEKIQLLCSVIRDLGEEFVCSPEQERKVRRILSSVPVVDFLNDVVLPPVWVSDVLRRLYGEIR